MKLLDQAMTETRTISHLLHPPLLDETGFASAARWYVEGFASRSGIQHPAGYTGRPWPPARTARAGAVPRPAGKPDQCSSPFQEFQGGCLAAGVSQRSRAQDQRLWEGNSSGSSGPLSPEPGARRRGPGGDAGADPRTWRTVGDGFGWTRHADSGEDPAFGAQEYSRNLGRLSERS